METALCSCCSSAPGLPDQLQETLPRSWSRKKVMGVAQGASESTPCRWRTTWMISSATLARGPGKSWEGHWGPQIPCWLFNISSRRQHFSKAAPLSNATQSHQCPFLYCLANTQERNMITGSQRPGLLPSSCVGDASSSSRTSFP